MNHCAVIRCHTVEVQTTLHFKNITLGEAGEKKSICIKSINTCKTTPVI